MNSDQDQEPNSDDAAIERALRISELQAELAELTGKPIAENLADAPEVDPHERFLEEMDALESGVGMPLIDLLQQRRNYIPPAPRHLTDPVQLHEELWLLLYALASIRVFFYDTNHLSEEELYDLLYKDVLPEEATILPEGSAWNCRYSMAEVSDGRHGGEDCFLRYYADESTRAYFADEFPDMRMPPKEELPYDRDDFLPTI